MKLFHWYFLLISPHLLITYDIENVVQMYHKQYAIQIYDVPELDNLQTYVQHIYVSSIYIVFLSLLSMPTTCTGYILYYWVQSIVASHLGTIKIVYLNRVKVLIIYF